jgi:phenylalanyl-tRNA synthetase beta chain
LVEEITRIVGFDQIPSVPLPRTPGVARPVLTTSQRRVPMAKRTLAARGMVECVTWSFLPRRLAERFGGGQAEMILENPISSELDAMRPSLLANLIDAVGRNLARGFENLAFFEVGGQFLDPTPKGELLVAGGVRRGATGARHWSGAARVVDALDAKADALAVLAAAGADTSKLQIRTEVPTWYHPGRAGALTLGPKNVLALFGEVHPGILDAMDVEGPIVGFEVFLDRVPQPKAKRNRTRAAYEVSDYPWVGRDFAFVVDDEVSAERVVRAALGADKNLITAVEVFDVYAGEGIEAGKKSIAISVRLEPQDRTLTDPEIDAVASRIVAQVQKATGASLRS